MTDSTVGSEQIEEWITLVDRLIEQFDPADPKERVDKKSFQDIRRILVMMHEDRSKSMRV